MTTNVKDIIDNVEQLKNEDEKKFDNADRTRGVIAGGFLGGLAGLMIGYGRKWNLLYSSIGGILIGSIAVRVMTRQKK